MPTILRLRFGLSPEHAMRISNDRARRAGNVLLLCALMLFVVFAVAALVIDLGLARITHRQMQGASDAAAREGVRYQDEIPAWVLDPNSQAFQDLQKEGIDPANPTNRDQVRRWL